jgi:hypothetical protein
MFGKDHQKKKELQSKEEEKPSPKKQKPKDFQK